MGEGSRYLKVKGHVFDCDGKAVQGAVLDVWHSDDEGHYDIQPGYRYQEGDLRGKFITDESGAWSFRTVLMKYYSIPFDGPVVSPTTLPWLWW